MKNSKKMLFIITCISIIVTIISIAQTYAKYKTSVSGDTNISIARWNILVNDSSIKNNEDSSFEITPTFAGNADIAANVLAPNAVGHFDLELDFSEVDVSFDYTISIISEENTLVADFITTGYSVDGGNIQEFTDATNTITDHISYTDDILEGITSKTITVYVKWNDDSGTQHMNNIDDTLTTLVEDGKRNTYCSDFLYSNNLRSNHIYS